MQERRGYKGFVFPKDAGEYCLVDFFEFFLFNSCVSGVDSEAYDPQRCGVQHFQGLAFTDVCLGAGSQFHSL